MGAGRETAYLWHKDTMPMLDTFAIAKRNQRDDLSPVVGGRMRRDAAFSHEITIEAIDPFKGLDVHHFVTRRRSAGGSTSSNPSDNERISVRRRNRYKR